MKMDKEEEKEFIKYMDGGFIKLFTIMFIIMPFLLFLRESGFFKV